MLVVVMATNVVPPSTVHCPPVMGVNIVVCKLMLKIFKNATGRRLPGQALLLISVYRCPKLLVGVLLGQNIVGQAISIVENLKNVGPI